MRHATSMTKGGLWAHVWILARTPAATNDSATESLLALKVKNSLSDDATCMCHQSFVRADCLQAPAATND